MQNISKSGIISDVDEKVRPNGWNVNRQRGDNAFSQKFRDKCFLFFKKDFLAVFVLCFFAAAVLADYKTTIQQANHYYGIGDYSQALELYREAYEEQPNPKLAYFIKKLEKLADTKPVDSKSDWAKQQNIISINSMAVLFSQINLSYTRALTPGMSLGFNFFYSWNSGMSLLYPGPATFAKATATGIGLDVDYYYDNKAPNGLYGGVGMNEASETYSLVGNLLGANSITDFTGVLSVHLGYRWIFGWGGCLGLQGSYGILRFNSGLGGPYLEEENLSFGWAF